MLMQSDGKEGKNPNAPCHAIRTAPAILAMLSTTPLLRTNIAAKPCVTLNRPQTLTSYIFFAAAISVSSKGITNILPALFTSTSSLPPVLFSTVETQLETEAGDVTSRGRISMDGFEAREVALATVRNVAKTWKFCAAKASASAPPREPSLQPVMTTVRLVMVVIVGFESAEEGKAGEMIDIMLVGCVSGSVVDDESPDVQESFAGDYSRARYYMASRLSVYL